MKSTAFVLLSIALTAISWGAYGPLLALGGRDMAGSHWLPFLFVGVAYFVIGVVATAALLVWRGEKGNWTTGGVIWSFLAGVVTAVGALCVILAADESRQPDLRDAAGLRRRSGSEHAGDDVDLEVTSRSRTVFLRRADSCDRRFNRGVGVQSAPADPLHQRSAPLPRHNRPSRRRNPRRWDSRN